MSNAHKTVVENLKERDNLLDRGIDGSLLNGILTRYGVKLWTELC